MAQWRQWWRWWSGDGWQLSKVEEKIRGKRRLRDRGRGDQVDVCGQVRQISEKGVVVYDRVRWEQDREGGGGNGGPVQGRNLL